ncbi:hypothetical protein DLM78_04280 [Leptospira stimsonii]|uniref:Uncharacterized protein n=1 Tax=Leptospira stimsonii TaxID=2202203 RepID=A0A8B3CVA9_9LEPT|nr:hypothetical protein DLM78_04280 [Leptospira stimsonii]
MESDLRLRDFYEPIFGRLLKFFLGSRIDRNCRTELSAPVNKLNPFFRGSFFDKQFIDTASISAAGTVRRDRSENRSQSRK